MPNKFLDMYPKLCKPKIGDIVQVQERECTGKIIDIDVYFGPLCIIYKIEVITRSNPEFNMNTLWITEQQMSVIKHA